MPKTEIDYSNTIIYKITCKDPNVKDKYVGHTTNFVQRKHAHKQSCINEKSANYKCKLYEVIRNNGGWNNWFMEIVGFFNCKDHYEARKKEQEYFEILQATLNSIEPMPKPKIDTFKNSKLEIHNKSKTHIMKQNNVPAQTPDTNIVNYQNDMNRYSCIICNYNTNHKSHYNKHLLSVKHKNSETLSSTPSHICRCNKVFNHRQNLCRHKKTCKFIHISEVIEPTTTISNDFLLEIIKQNKELKNIIVEQNNDLQNKLLNIINLINRDE